MDNVIQKEKPKVEKVIKGDALVKKRPFGRRIIDAISNEDTNTVKNYILIDVLIPAIKKGLYDIITSGLEMYLYGGARKETRSSTQSKVSYRSYYDDKYSRRDSKPIRTNYNYDEIILKTRMEAEEVLTHMDDLIDIYGLVSVADYYDLVGEESRYTDNNYGWTNLSNATITRTRDGYSIRLPKALPIN